MTPNLDVVLPLRSSAQASQVFYSILILRNDLMRHHSPQGIAYSHFELLRFHKQKQPRKIKSKKINEWNGTQFT